MVILILPSVAKQRADLPARGSLSPAPATVEASRLCRVRSEARGAGPVVEYQNQSFDGTVQKTVELMGRITATVLQQAKLTAASRHQFAREWQTNHLLATRCRRARP